MEKSLISIKVIRRDGIEITYFYNQLGTLPVGYANAHGDYYPKDLVLLLNSRRHILTKDAKEARRGLKKGKAKFDSLYPAKVDNKKKEKKKR